MIINKITLDNFKSHKHSVINLTRGISVILGENGAGKSSIFEAISYSFFKTQNGKIEDHFRKATDDNDKVNEMKVTVEFEHGSNNYELIRGKKKSSNIAKLYRNDSDESYLICEGDTLVTKEIEKLLSLDSKSFLNAVYIRQGEITDLIEKTAAEKKELIAKLLNIDSLQKANEDIKQVIDIYNNQINEYDIKLHDKSDVEENINNLNERIKDNRENLEKINPEIEKMDIDLKDLEIKVLKSDHDKNEFKNLKEQKGQQEKLVSTVKESKEKVESRLKEIEDSEKQMLDLEPDVIKLPMLEKLQDYKNDLNQHIEKQRIIQDSIEIIIQNTKIIEEKRENHDRYETVKTKKEALENERSLLESKVNENSIIEHKLKDLENERTKYFDNINKTSESAKELFNEYFNSPEEIEKKVEEESKTVKENIQKLNDTINENKNKLSVIKNNLKNTEKSLKELENTRDTCPICQSPISHDKHRELSDDYKEKISEYAAGIDQLNNDNEKWKNELDESEKYLEAIESINITKLHDDYEEFKRILKDKEEYEKSLPEIEENKNKLEELKNDIVESSTLMNNLEEDYNSYNVAYGIFKTLPDIEEEERKLNEINSKINEIKGLCHEIIIRYKVTDDLKPLIDYTKKRVELYNQCKGMVQNKESVLKEKEEAINNFNKEENNLKILEDEIKNLSYNEEENTKLHETYTSQNNELEKSKLRRNTIETEIKSDELQLDDKKKELQNLKNLSEERENLKKYVEILNDIRNLYGKDGVQKELRDNARPEIERYTMDLFNEFDFEYTSLELNEDYDVSIENKNEELDLKMMSGGEKIVIALALRLGIATTVSQNRTDLLLLDEPTIHLDAERRSRLIDIIRDINFVPQMIVVSHDDEMESISNNVIKIVKKNGISCVDDS